MNVVTEPETKKALEGKLVISIAAGVRLEQLAGWLPGSQVIRAMPNTPCLIGEGMTVIARGKGVSDAHAAQATEIFTCVGRCLEAEDVPYKAIDNLIDELSDWWLALGPKDAQALLPRDAHLLPTLFPVLDRVPAIADAPRTRQVGDPQARRTHAYDALRETLQRLGDRHTVVLVLDDMQWVDRDTMTLLVDLMRAPDPPSLLFVLATRVEGSAPVLDLGMDLL